MNWLDQLVPMPIRQEPEAPPYTAKNTGRGGTPIKYMGRYYKSWTEASKRTGLTKSALRWRLLKKEMA